MSFAEILANVSTEIGPQSFMFAAGHIVLVLIYAFIAGWGRIGLENRVLGVPGGAMVVSPPIIEFLIYWWVPTNTPAGVFVGLVAGHMLAVRLLLNLIGVVAILLRWTGQVDAVICMDNRTWTQASANKTCSNHSGLCGAFATLSLVGFMPGLALVGWLLISGMQIPVWVAVLAAFPIIFVLGKHFHLVLFQMVGDLLELTEIPGQIIGSILIGLVPGWQFCAYNAKHHDHDGDGH